MLKSLKKNRGFTLIELLVVIAIIGILASIVLVSLSGARNRAKDTRIISEMSQIRSLAELFYNEQNPNTYSGVEGDTRYTKISADITSQGGALSQVVGANDYCAYSTLVTQSGGAAQWYCVDSTGTATTTAVDPSGVGYCDTTAPTYVCP